MTMAGPLAAAVRGISVGVELPGEPDPLPPAYTGELLA